MTSIETDAHGYFCAQCSGKFYTGAKEFLAGKCPKCGQEALVDVAGYWCEKDQHTTIHSKLASSATAIICEKCGAPLRGKMVSPKEKDFLAWGAAKTSAPR